MSRPAGDTMGESRAGLLEAAVLMDEGRYRESVEVCIRSAERSLIAMLASWGLEAPATGCWEMMKTFGRHTSTDISSWLRHCCKRIDRHRAFFAGVEEERLDRIFDEEYAMELINYAREVLKFSGRNLNRDRAGDSS